MIEAIFNDNLLQIRSTITEHKHLSVITNKIYFGCAIINAICQVRYNVIVKFDSQIVFLDNLLFVFNTWWRSETK